MTATELAGLIRGREVSAREVTEANRTGVLARPTGFRRADAINIQIPFEGAGEWLRTPSESAKILNARTNSAVQGSQRIRS
jgi:hypothetical protein